MLYISLGCALVYLMTQMTQNPLLYSLLVFDRGAILQGQVWRLVTYPLTFYNSNLLLMAVRCFAITPSDGPWKISGAPCGLISFISAV